MLPDFSKLKQVEHPELLLEQAEPFLELMMKYNCAVMEIETKIKILNEELSHKNQRNPIESIKTSRYKIFAFESLKICKLCIITSS